jgi:NitT/TauT family transport system substrate-binding protein
MGHAGPVRGLLRGLDQGFYEEENLDVTILPGGPDIAPTR